MISIAFSTDCPDKLREALVAIRENGFQTQGNAVSVSHVPVRGDAGPSERAWRQANPGRNVKFTERMRAEHGTREEFFLSLLTEPEGDGAQGATYEPPDDVDTDAISASLDDY